MTSEQGFLLGKNATLVCLGDSITQASDGYVTVMRHLIHARYPDRNIHVVNSGIGGNKAPDMLTRLRRDVTAHKPSCVTINVGINDVWHAFYDFGSGQPAPNGDLPSGVPLAAYEPTVALIVDMLREETDAEIALLTPTVIGEDLDNPENRANARLEEYVEAMRRVAATRNTLLVDTHVDFVAAIRAGKAANPEFHLTTDGVHLNAIGNHVMALSILSAFGF